MCNDPQRVVVDIDVLPGPFTEAVAERLLRLVTDELLPIGLEVTRKRIEIQGPISAWWVNRLRRSLPDGAHGALPSDVCRLRERQQPSPGRLQVR